MNKYYFNKMKKKKRLLFLGLLSFLSFFLFSEIAAAESNNYPPDIKKIIKKGVLRVGLIGSTNEFPFFFFDKNKKLTGLDVNMAEELAQSLGVKLDFNRSATTYQGVVDLVEQGTVDLGISLLSGTMSRAKKSSFTQPYIYLYEGLLVNRLKLSELKRKSNFFDRINTEEAIIGYLKDSGYEYFAKRIFTKAKLKGFPYQKYLTEEVKKGTITAGLVDEKQIKTFAIFNPNDILYVETVEIRDFKDPICIFVAYENKHLLFYVNAFLERRPRASFNQLIQQYYQPGIYE